MNMECSYENSVLKDFCRMMEMGRNTIFHFLSDEVVLDWYGRTIAGKADVLEFLFHAINFESHCVTLIENPRPLPRKDILVNAMRRASLRSIEENDHYVEDFDEDSGFMSGVWDSISDSSFSSTDSQTPISRVTKSFANIHINAPHPLPRITSTDTNLHTPKNSGITGRSLRLLPHGAPQKIQSSSWDPDLKINMIEAKGTISFSRYEPMHDKWLQWTRDCCLQLGYTTDFDSHTAIQFSVLSYHDDMPCRRNLINIFEQCD